jgi:NTE family protein
MKTALVLSGGGSKGAFQVGALSYLRQQGIQFDCVAGVSVGSLNGSMVAQGKFDELNSVWNTITEKDVYLKPSWLKILWNNLTRQKMSLYDLSPLGKILEQHVSLTDMKIPFYAGITSLYDRKYYSVGLQDFYTDGQLRDAIYASSLMPILWEPTQVQTKTGLIQFAVDGGVKNVIPLADIIQEDCDRIIVITCNNTDVPIEPSVPKTIIDVAEITFLETMLDEIVRTDIAGIERYNDVVKQATEQGAVIRHKSGRKLKYFELIKIQPPVKIGSSTDFSREIIDKNLKLGYDTARNVVESLIL